MTGLAEIVGEVLGDAIAEVAQLREGIGGPHTLEVIESFAKAASDAWDEARTIRTAEQLGALPEQSVVINIAFGVVFECCVENDGSVVWRSPGGLVKPTVMLPALALWHPEWATL